MLLPPRSTVSCRPGGTPRGEPVKSHNTLRELDRLLYQARSGDARPTPALDRQLVTKATRRRLIRCGHAETPTPKPDSDPQDRPQRLTGSLGRPDDAYGPAPGVSVSRRVRRSRQQPGSGHAGAYSAVAGLSGVAQQRPDPTGGSASVGELVGQQAHGGAAGGGRTEGDVDQGRFGWGADTHCMQCL
jgi:hypothetical protein